MRLSYLLGRYLQLFQTIFINNLKNYLFNLTNILIHVKIYTDLEN